LLYPREEIPYGQPTKSLLNYNYKYFYQLFNERQLLLLSMLLDEILKIEEEMVREFFLIIFSGGLYTNNISCRYDPLRQHLTPIFESNYYLLPNSPNENNVWGTRYGRGSFVKVLNKGIKALDYLPKPYQIKLEKKTKKNGIKVLDRVNFEIQGDKIDGKITYDFEELEKENGTKNALLLCRTSEDLSFIPDKSIDAVITDPPYFDNVMYSELSDFFYVWLRLGLKDTYPDMFGLPLTNKDREIVKNNAQGKDKNFFTEGLKKVFKESNRVLKDEGIMAFTFHHKNTAAWGAVLKALLDSNFKIIQTYPIYSETKGGLRDFNINYDSIIVCKKRIQKEVQKIPYAIFEVQLRDRINKGVDRIIEMHPDLEFEDAYTIAMGNALHLYSENYGGIIHNGKTLEINEALETLGDIVFDILLRKILVKVPDVDRVSKIYSAVFATKTKVTTDTVNKITRHGGIDTNAFENEVLIKRTKGDMEVQSAKERKKHLKKKIENDLPLLYIDAAHYLLLKRKEGTNFSQGVMEVLKSIDKNKLESYIQFLGERTKDTEW
ncbi:MAG: DNA methyltransferase, partial [Methanosarcinales archaeon]